MAKHTNKPKQLRPWDRQPWPKRGSKSAERLYASIGRALSSWEYFEADLGVIFSLLAARTVSTPARRAYYAVRTFEGRAEMLQAASEAFFAECANSELQDEFKALYKSAKLFAPRRNDIAHGVVDHFRRDPLLGARKRFKSFALYPSFANYKDRALDQMPAYCYSAVEIDHYCYEFRGLVFSGGHLVEGIRAEIISS